PDYPSGAAAAEQSAAAKTAGSTEPDVSTDQAPAETLSESNQPTNDIRVLRSGFGLFNEPQSGKPRFEMSAKVPLREGQSYGWVIQLQTEKPKITWREELVLPARPPRLSVGPGTTVSADGLTVSTEREIAPNEGFILHAWSVAAGDPAGRHVVRVYVD